VCIISVISRIFISPFSFHICLILYHWWRMKIVAVILRPARHTVSYFEDESFHSGNRNIHWWQCKDLLRTVYIAVTVEELYEKQVRMFCKSVHKPFVSVFVVSVFSSFWFFSRFNSRYFLAFLVFFYIWLFFLSNLSVCCLFVCSIYLISSV